MLATAVAHFQSIAPERTVSRGVRLNELHESSGGRVMEVWTREAGLQFRAGNFLNGSVTGKDGKSYQRHFGFCLETQHYPDSPNKPAFPSNVLRRGQCYQTITIYRFSTC